MNLWVHMEYDMDIDITDVTIGMVNYSHFYLISKDITCLSIVYSL